MMARRLSTLVPALSLTAACGAGDVAFSGSSDACPPSVDAGPDAAYDAGFLQPDICEPVRCDEAVESYCATPSRSCPTFTADGFTDPNAGICAWFDARQVMGGAYRGPVTCRSGARGIAMRPDGELWFLFDDDGGTVLPPRDRDGRGLIVA